MIRAEGEEQDDHRSPDSDYYADLMNRVDSAMEEDDEGASVRPVGGSPRSIGALSPCLSGARFSAA